MGILLRVAAGVAMVAVIGGFVVNKVPTWKERAIEVINPVAKERRLLGELSSNLEDIDASLADLSDDNGSDFQAKIAYSQNLLHQSRDILGGISELNDKNSGIVRRQVGKIIDAIIDKTPYPADHLDAAQNTLLPAASCSPR